MKFPANDPAFKEPHFPALMGRVGETIEMPDKQHENVIHPVAEARVITVNGQVWAALLSVFGLTEEGVKKLWDEQPSLFTRVTTTSSAT